MSATIFRKVYLLRFSAQSRKKLSNIVYETFMLFDNFISLC